MLSESDNPPGEDISSGDLSGISCPECGKSFTSDRSLQGHMFRSHRVKPGSPPSEPRVKDESPLADMFHELPQVKSAYSFSVWKNRLRQQDQRLYSLLFPGEVQDRGPTAALVDVEVAKTLRELRDETDPKSAGDSALREEVVTLREEVKGLREEARQRELDGLKSELREIRQRLDATGDSIVGLAREGRELLKGWQGSEGGPFLRSLSPLASSFTGKVLENYDPSGSWKQKQVQDDDARTGLMKRLPPRLIAEE